MATSNPGPREVKPTTDPATQINNALRDTPQNLAAGVVNKQQTPAQQINSAMQNAATPTQQTAPINMQNAVKAPARGAYDQPLQNPSQQVQPTAQTQANAQTTQEALGGVYKVGDNGQAPKGLKVGDQVVTGGGTYTIKGVNADGTYQSQLTNPNQTTGNYSGSYANTPSATMPAASGKIYKVGADGNAPKGLQAGDQVVTAGGTYLITAVNPDGSYQTQLTNQSQTTSGYKGAYSSLTTPTGNVYQVDANGNAPKGLNPGDQVVTANGIYIIEAVNKDGSYVSTLINADIGTGNYRGEYTRDPNLPQEQEKVNPATTIQELLDQWRAQAEAAAQNKINYNVEKGVNELNRAMEDAQPQFQQQLDQLDIDTARAMSNSALYAEARGDRGGIGQSQYNEIQAAALKNKQAINTARTKLATDTARQIADLRAQGEFEAADQLLTIGQQYLQQLISLEQWGADWQMSQEQMARELEQWEKNYALQVANATGEYNGRPTYSAQKYEQENLAARAEMKIKMGVMPTAAELAAIGMTEAEAAAAAWNLSGGAYSIGSGGGNFSSGDSYSSGGSGSSGYSGSGSGGSGYSGSGSGGSGGGGGGGTTAKAPNAALTYRQPKDSAPTPWQKAAKAGTQ